MKDDKSVTNALTVRLDEINDKVYVADPILTLDMAYNNARLVQKPEESDWLNRS